MRAALGDLYDNSFRFLGANLLLGIVLLIVAFLAIGTPLALVGLIVAVPFAAGLMAMATQLVRNEHCDFSDFTAELGRPWRSLLIGAVQLLIGFVLVFDIVLGGGLSGALGAFLSVSALYGLLVWWLYAVALWPLLLDPLRAGEPTRRLLRLALVIVVARPIRLLLLGLLLGALLGVSTVAVAPLVTVSVALAWLVAARWVLPFADALEGRQPVDVEPHDAWAPGQVPRG